MSRRSSTKRKRKRTLQSRRVGPSDTKVGWFAHYGTEALCDGDACIIGGSRSAIEKMVKRVGSGHWKIRSTTFGEIWRGLGLRGAYAFDEAAYKVFLPLAQQKGLRLKEEDFSDPGPTGVHLVRVKIVPPRRPRTEP